MISFKTREKLRYLRMTVRPTYFPMVYTFGWWGLLYVGVLTLISRWVEVEDKAYHASNVDEHELDAWLQDPFFKWNTLVHVLLFGCLLAWCCWVLSQDPAWYWIIAIFLYVSLLGGEAIICAHELIHRQGKLESILGGIMLSYFGYGSFKVEHVRGHHVFVSTPKDASSARLNQSLYDFVPKAIGRNIYNGYRLENKRLKKLGLPWYSYHNEVLMYAMLSLAFVCLALIVCGPLAASFLVFQSFISIGQLEIINYIEHYGLERVKLENGRYEKVTPLHSWNVRMRATTLNLMRHSDHHAYPSRRYQILQHHDSAPQLPADYDKMILLALRPKIWFKVMNPRAIAHMEKLKEMSLKNGVRYFEERLEGNVGDGIEGSV